MIRDLETLKAYDGLVLNFLHFFFLSLTELVSYMQISPFLSFYFIFWLDL
jgi:hypothetical protein